MINKSVTPFSPHIEIVGKSKERPINNNITGSNNSIDDKKPSFPSNDGPMRSPKDGFGQARSGNAVSIINYNSCSIENWETLKKHQEQ